jgi:hypothetical protein
MGDPSNLWRDPCCVRRALSCPLDGRCFSRCLSSPTPQVSPGVPRRCALVPGLAHVDPRDLVVLLALAPLLLAAWVAASRLVRARCSLLECAAWVRCLSALLECAA